MWIQRLELGCQYPMNINLDGPNLTPSPLWVLVPCKLEMSHAKAIREIISFLATAIINVLEWTSVRTYLLGIIPTSKNKSRNSLEMYIS